MMENQQTQEWKDLEQEDIIISLKRAWRSPGIDKVSNFWLKNLDEVQEDMVREYSKIIQNAENTPSWLNQGLTYLLPKSAETKSPKNYRPITCLPTLYKILTATLTERACMSRTKRL